MARINIHSIDENTGTRTLLGWFDPDAAETFTEAKAWNGDIHLGVISGGQLGYQALHRTKGGAWVMESNFRREFNGPHTHEFITPEQAHDWLIRSEINDEAAERFFGEVEEERSPGRPEVGPAFKIRFEQDLLDWTDAQAKAAGVSRAELIRQYVKAARAATSKP